MIDKLIDLVKNDKSNWERFQDMFVERAIPPKSTLLKEGEIASQLFFIKKGCLRMWFNKDGKDITLQFFFEGQGVASIESLLSGQPSLFTIESIEPTTLISISKENFELLHTQYPSLKDGFYELILHHYMLTLDMDGF